MASTLSRLSEPSATCLMCSGRLSRPTQPGAPSGRSLNPNLVAITTCSRTGARASPTSSSFVNGPYASAVSAADVGVSQCPVRPEIAAADAGAGDGDERVGWLDEAGVGDVLDANVAGAEHDGSTHGDLPLVFGGLEVVDVSAHRGARYCSSLTFSIQSTLLPSSCSTMAMWVMAVSAVAPCQCFSPGGLQITSPGRISLIGPPQLCTRPQPAVTIRV